MPEHPQEYYWPEGLSADALTRVLEPGARVRRTAPTTVRRLLWETFDGRLHRRGEVLETAEEGASTLLLWRRLDGGVLRRLAAPAPRFARDLPPGPFRDRLEKVTQMRALLPLARIETRAQALEILDQEDKVVCRVFAEEHRAGAPGEGEDLRRLAPRVRIEPVRGYPGAAERFGKHWPATSPSGRWARTSWRRHWLSRAGRRPPTRRRSGSPWNPG
ncbi:MAG: hypothetical protein IH608_10570 [Proteobacteria bacterium]|nr:hypothetical protein [Pseudomonadota bacterium]